MIQFGDAKPYSPKCLSLIFSSFVSGLALGELLVLSFPVHFFVHTHNTVITVIP
jgi:hypothetical protein